MRRWMSAQGPAEGAQADPLEGLNPEDVTWDAVRERGELSDHDLGEIQASAIAPHVALARGYRTVRKRPELERLGFSPGKCRIPSLLIPWHTLTVEKRSYQIKPRVSPLEDGEPKKYLCQAGMSNHLDVSPLIREWIKDPLYPVWFTEGIKKTDAAISQRLCCIGLNGVFGWRGKNELGGPQALADFEQVPLNRKVYLAFDSDCESNRQVHEALRRFRGFLASKGADVWFVSLPSQADE